MQTLELNLPSPVLLVWGLPAGNDRFHVYNDGDSPYISYFHEFQQRRFDIKGSWQLIGKLSELVEEQAKGLVKFVGSPWCAFKDYTTNKNWFSGALESFHSAIEAEGYYLKNPYGEREDILFEGNCSIIAEWGKAQSKTLPANTLIFKRA